MKNKAWFLLTDSEVRSLACAHGFSAVKNIKALPSEGVTSLFEFKGTLNGEEMLADLKVSPPDVIGRIACDKLSLRQEKVNLELLEKNGGIKLPAVLAFDFSRKVISSDYLIMRKNEGVPVSKLAGSEKANAARSAAEILAVLHSIEGKGFGYRQNGLYVSWYNAIKNMVANVVMDCERRCKKAYIGYDVMYLIDKFADVLRGVRCSFVHGNLTESSFIGGDCLTLTGFERSFFGDPIADFVLLRKGKQLSGKWDFIDLYNAFSDEKILQSKDVNVRYHIMEGYYGLLLHTERYYLYKKTDIRFWLNGIRSHIMTRRAVAYLKCEDSGLLDFIRRTTAKKSVTKGGGSLAADMINAAVETNAEEGTDEAKAETVSVAAADVEKETPQVSAVETTPIER